jgi:hypothetical protein
LSHCNAGTGGSNVRNNRFSGLDIDVVWRISSLATQQELGIRPQRRIGPGFSGSHCSDCDGQNLIHQRKNIMKIALNFELALVSALLTLGLVGCSKPGPAETAGKKIDQMSESASAAVADTVNKADDMATKGSETTGQKMDDAEKTVKDRY